jgi:hypothetical protein
VLLTALCFATPSVAIWCRGRLYILQDTVTICYSGPLYIPLLTVAIWYSESLSFLQPTVLQFGKADSFIYCRLQ